MILVLGHKGMLGNVLVDEMSVFPYARICPYRFPSAEFFKYIRKCKPDMIVNCISCNPQKKYGNFDMFFTNLILPIMLNYMCKKNIYPSTDVYKKGPYYRYKWILDNLKLKNTKIIKSSLVGRELESRDYFLENVLHDDSFVGRKNEVWHGLTTLEWAEECKDVYDNWQKRSQVVSPPVHAVSKHELASTIKNVFHIKKYFAPSQLSYALTRLKLHYENKFQNRI